MRNDYSYAIELWLEDGTPLGRVRTEVDWVPAEEWARFEVLRHGGARDSAVSTAILEPVWHSTLGKPYMDGFKVEMRHPDREPLAFAFGRTYFRKSASHSASELVARGQLKEGDPYQFAAVALEEDPNPRPDGLRVASTPQPLPVRSAKTQDAVAKAVGIGTIDTTDMPVIVDSEILDEIRDLAVEAGSVETGGFLVGHIHRDADTGETFAGVTVQLRARYTVAEATRLTFTPQTWTDARASLSLRSQGEIFLGWWHTHVAWHICRNCAPDRQKVCLMAGDFFSEHDHLLHRVAFGGAHNIALVANVVQGERSLEVTFSTFGWRRGMIETRGIHSAGSAVAAPAQEVSGSKEAPCPVK